MSNSSTFISLTINGEIHSLIVDNRWTLLNVLREAIGLKGTKRGCDRGECGACTVILTGRLVNACQILAISLDGFDVRTIEGLSDGPTIHRVQKAFLENDGGQCGFCTPGFVMSAVALLESNPYPTKEEIVAALGGNLCRCNAYGAIVDSVKGAAGKSPNG